MKDIAAVDEIHRLDERFERLVSADAAVRLLHDGGAFTEGPVWFGELDQLIWSDIPNDRLLARTRDGHVRVFRSPSRFANGNTRDRAGRLVTCEHGARRVTRTEPDGSITVIADRYDGRALNSPNDVVVRSDGTVWFTDPDYGLRQNLPGVPREQDYDHVFRADPVSGRLDVVADDFEKPNGLAFSPDERILYVADSAVTEGPDHPSHIRRFEVDETGRVRGGGVFVTTVGVPDGMRVDRNGNLWASAGSGVNVYLRDATLLGRIPFPADVTNLEFGSPGDGSLFVTAGGSLFVVSVLAQGARNP
jgi:gluconolactonase